MKVPAPAKWGGAGGFSQIMSVEWSEEAWVMRTRQAQGCFYLFSVARTTLGCKKQKLLTRIFGGNELKKKKKVVTLFSNCFQTDKLEICTLPSTLHPFHPSEEGSVYQAVKGAALEDGEQLELTLEVSSLSALSTGPCPGTRQERSLLILASQSKCAHENTLKTNRG